MGELVFLGVLAVMGIIMFGMSFSFTTSAIDASGGPAVFPRIVIIGLIIFMVMRAVEILRKEEERKKEFHFLEIFKGSRLFFVILFILYAASIKTVGFVIASTFFGIILIAYLHKKQYGNYASIKKSIITYCIFTVSIVAVYYIFTNYFSVNLPAGILDF